ncbi:MAG: hypothetical protein VR68_00580 [Peptococcaceae bacterium BRH_c4a]|nr:MAG: hypothetical protein VR68_00580 [Peptococcaceae bacterium BRH_c4a]
MKWMRMLGLGEMSPLGMLVAGALIGTVGLPAVKKGVRGVAVSTVGAALTVTDFVKNSSGNVSRGWRELLEDVKMKRIEDGHTVKGHLHDAAADLAGAGVAVAEMAREKVHDLKESLENKVAQTREEPAEMKSPVKAGPTGETGNDEL